MTSVRASRFGRLRCVDERDSTICLTPSGLPAWVRSTGFVLLCIAFSALAIVIHGMPASIASHRASGAIADGFLLLSFAMSLAGIWQAARKPRSRSR